MFSIYQSEIFITLVCVIGISAVLLCATLKFLSRSNQPPIYNINKIVQKSKKKRLKKPVKSPPKRKPQHQKVEKEMKRKVDKQVHAEQSEEDSQVHGRTSEMEQSVAIIEYTQQQKEQQAAACAAAYWSHDSCDTTVAATVCSLEVGYNGQVDGDDNEFSRKHTNEAIDLEDRTQRDSSLSTVDNEDEQNSSESASISKDPVIATATTASQHVNNTNWITTTTTTAVTEKLNQKKSRRNRKKAKTKGHTNTAIVSPITAESFQRDHPSYPPPSYHQPWVVPPDQEKRHKKTKHKHEQQNLQTMTNDKNALKKERENNDEVGVETESAPSALTLDTSLCDQLEQARSENSTLTHELKLNKDAAKTTAKENARLEEMLHDALQKVNLLQQKSAEWEAKWRSASVQMAAWQEQYAHCVADMKQQVCREKTDQAKLMDSYREQKDAEAMILHSALQLKDCDLIMCAKQLDMERVNFQTQIALVEEKNEKLFEELTNERQKWRRLNSQCEDFKNKYHEQQLETKKLKQSKTVLEKKLEDSVNEVKSKSLAEMEEKFAEREAELKLELRADLQKQHHQHMENKEQQLKTLQERLRIACEQSEQLREQLSQTKQRETQQQTAKNEHEEQTATCEATKHNGIAAVAAVIHSPESPDSPASSACLHNDTETRGDSDEPPPQMNGHCQVRDTTKAKRQQRKKKRNKSDIAGMNGMMKHKEIHSNKTNSELEIARAIASDEAALNGNNLRGDNEENQRNGEQQSERKKQHINVERVAWTPPALPSKLSPHNNVDLVAYWKEKSAQYESVLIGTETILFNLQKSVNEEEANWREALLELQLQNEELRNQLQASLQTQKNKN